MSANNWAICPKCEEIAREVRNAAIQRVVDDYGKIPRDEYTEVVRDSEREYRPRSTLREDYEIGIRNGVFEVGYRAECEVCGLSHEFHHKEVVKI